MGVRVPYGGRMSCCALAAATLAAPQETWAYDPALTRAATAVYVAAQTGPLLRDWCLLRAPARAGAVQADYAAWWRTQGLDRVESHLQDRLGAEPLAHAAKAAQAQREDFNAQLDRTGQSADGPCSQFGATLARTVTLQASAGEAYATTALLRTAGHGRGAGRWPLSGKHRFQPAG